MSKQISTNERVSSSPALNGTGATASGVEYDDDSSGPDEYDNLLAEIGRAEDEDLRISVHEAGHALCARLLGNEVGGVTVHPGKGYEGRCWGVGHKEAFSKGAGDASDVRAALAPLMPKAGEQLTSVADVFSGSYAHCVELMAGRAAEGILLEGDPPPQTDDHRQARELALLFCKSAVLPLGAKAQLRPAVGAKKVGVLWHAANPDEEREYLTVLTKAFSDWDMSKGRTSVSYINIRQNKLTDTPCLPGSWSKAMLM